LFRIKNQKKKYSFEEKSSIKMKIFQNLILVVFALQAHYFLCNAELEVEGEEKPASYVG
jgi:hypothetical protein